MAKIYLLNNIKYDGVENLDVFGIKFLESKIDLNDYDALIFTSKNAIYAIESFNKDWKNIPSYAIAPKTAQVINEQGGNVVFTGIASHGNDFAQELIPIVKDKKALYIRAKKTVSSLVELLKKDDIKVDELIAYETACKKSNKVLEVDSTFIFTSPSSVECFLKNYNWDKSYKAIAIGKTTAKYLPEYINFEISSKTSIEECIKLAFKELA